MTIKSARKILGSQSNSMTDKQILRIINIFTKVIEAGFQQFELKSNNKYRGVDNVD